MKKIIFVINNLETGGVQKSLLNLLLEIHNKYEITLLTFFGNEDFEKSLPENIKVLKTKSSFRQLGMSVKHTKGKPFMYLARAFWVMLARFFGRSLVVKLMLPFQKQIKGYDCAISFLHEGNPKIVYGGCNDFVLKKIEAKQKIGWIHCDFGLCGADVQKSRRIYEGFDNIIACSEGARRAFLKCYPEFADKTVSVRNCNDYETIRELAGDGIEYDAEYVNIVTVARLSSEKGIERALEAVHECITKGYKIKYHIVGSGDRENLLKNKCTELGLDDAVVFYGNKPNPYPYMKNADLFLLTSYHEAAPMVFDEAACLCVPVLATETTSTYEMLEECGYGIVCKNDQEDITAALLEVVSSREKIDEIKNRLAGASFDNREPIEKLIGVIR